MSLWEIRGTGRYFDTFYVKAESLPIAISKARDILSSGWRARYMDNNDVTDFMRSVSIYDETVIGRVIKP